MVLCKRESYREIRGCLRVCALRSAVLVHSDWRSGPASASANEFRAEYGPNTNGTTEANNNLNGNIEDAVKLCRESQPVANTTTLFSLPIRYRTV